MTKKSFILTAVATIAANCINMAFAQTFTFSIALQNFPANGVASGSIELSFTYDTCAPNSKTATGPDCPSGGVAPARDAFPNGLSRFVLRKGLPSGAPNTIAEFDLLNGADAIPILDAGTFTISDLSQYTSGYYVVVMEGTDANNNPVRGISNYFQIGGSPPEQTGVVLVTPATGSVWRTETFDTPYLIRWQYIDTTQQPDTFTVDLLDEAGTAIVVPIYTKSRFVFTDTLLTGAPLNAANWVIPKSLGNQRYRLRLKAEFANATTTPLEATTGPFTITNNAYSVKFSSAHIWGLIGVLSIVLI